MTTNRLCWLLSAFVLLAAIYSANAKAETYVYAGAWSDHPFSENDYNERHDLLGVEHKGVIAGYFRNSYSEDSFVTGYRFKRAYGDLEASLIVGATYGYRHCVKGYADRSKRVCPVAVPMVTYTKYQVEPSLMVLGSAVAVGFSFKL